MGFETAHIIYRTFSYYKSHPNTLTVSPLALHAIPTTNRYVKIGVMSAHSRSRRPSGNSGSKPSKWQRGQGSGRDISRILDPAPRIERAFDGDWLVQFMPGVNALKTYTCPECGRKIPPGIAHLVVWQENHLFGRDRAIAERRHWHSKCWQARSKW